MPRSLWPAHQSELVVCGSSQNMHFTLSKVFASSPECSLSGPVMQAGCETRNLAGRRGAESILGTDCHFRADVSCIVANAVCGMWAARHTICSVISAKPLALGCVGVLSL